MRAHQPRTQTNANSYAQFGNYADKYEESGSEREWEEESECVRAR